VKCKNCKTELTALNGAPYRHPTLLWCGLCGMLVVDRPKEFSEKNVTESSRETIWFEPESIENTKKLINMLLKARANKSNGVSKDSKEDMDKIDYNDDDRR